MEWYQHVAVAFFFPWTYLVRYIPDVPVQSWKSAWIYFRLFVICVIFFFFASQFFWKMSKKRFGILLKLFSAYTLFQTYVVGVFSLAVIEYFGLGRLIGEEILDSQNYRHYSEIIYILCIFPLYVLGGYFYVISFKKTLKLKSWTQFFYQMVLILGFFQAASLPFVII